MIILGCGKEIILSILDQYMKAYYKLIYLILVEILRTIRYK